MEACSHSEAHGIMLSLQQHAGNDHHSNASVEVAATSAARHSSVARAESAHRMRARRAHKAHEAREHTRARSDRRGWSQAAKRQRSEKKRKQNPKVQPPSSSRYSHTIQYSPAQPSPSPTTLAARSVKQGQQPQQSNQWSQALDSNDQADGDRLATGHSRFNPSPRVPKAGQAKGVRHGVRPVHYIGSQSSSR